MCNAQAHPPHQAYQIHGRYVIASALPVLSVIRPAGITHASLEPIGIRVASHLDDE